MNTATIVDIAGYLAVLGFLWLVNRETRRDLRETRGDLGARLDRIEQNQLAQAKDIGRIEGKQDLLIGNLLPEHRSAATLGPTPPGR